MTKLTQTSWLGGQMDVRMTGRQDMGNYRNGASVLKNFVPVKLGSIRKRPGTDFVSDITSYVGTGRFRMIPFGYLSSEGFVLVFKNKAARAFCADGTHVDVVFDGSTELPYTSARLDSIGYVQCNDIIFVAHKDIKPGKIEHDYDEDTGIHSFVFSYVDFNPVTAKPTIDSATYTRAWFQDFTFGKGDQDVMDNCKAQGDFTDPNDRYRQQYAAIYGDTSRRKYNGTTVVNYRASLVVDGSEGPLSDIKAISFTSPWTESQVATINVSATVPSGTKEWELRLYKENGGVYGLVGSTKGTGSGSKTHTFKDDNIAPDTSVTPIDTTGVTKLTNIDDRPGCVALYQQRLVWAGTNNDPARIWMSRAGDFYEYRPHVKLQTDDAIDFILPITQFGSINHIVELGRLFAFAECTELLIGSASDNQGVSYETIMASEHSHLGCTKRLPPIVANNTLLFVNRTGQSVRDYDERIGSSRFGGTDVSIFSSSIFAENPIVDWTWQQEPNSTVWCVLKDGQLASFTYNKEQEIGAWAVHELGGGGKARGIAKTCAVFGRDAAHPTTGEVMVAVERGDGADRRVTLERMRPWGAADGSEADRLCMDCMEPGQAVGKTVVGLPDGTVVSGYVFESVMTTMPPVIGDQGGASQFDVKLGQHAHLRTVGSQGGEIYAVGMRDQPSRIDDGAVRDGEDDARFRDVDVVLAGSNNRDGRVTVRHDEPRPFQLALLELDYEVEG